MSNAFWYALVAACVCVSAIVEARVFDNELDTDLQVIRECNQSVPVPLDALNTVLVHKRLSGLGDDKFKCFLHCLFVKYGWMDEEGSFLLGNIRHSLSAVQVNQMKVRWLIYRCTAGGEPSVCERAYRFTSCFWTEIEKAPEVYREDGDIFRLL